MSGKNEYIHAAKISHQLHKNYVFQRGSETIQQAVPARGYITYSSPEIRDHRGDGQWQTQRRYDSPPEKITTRDHRASDYYANSGNTNPKPSQMRSDYFNSFHNQGTPNSSNDPLFDEFLSSLMESFEGYDNPNIMGYQSEFPPPIGHNVSNFRNSSSYHYVFTTNARPGSPLSTRAASHRPEYGPWAPGPRVDAIMSHRPENGPWPPGPRASGDRYPQMDEKRHYGPHFLTKQTQYRYPSSPDAHSGTERFGGPGKQRSEISPQRNSRYREHEYAPPAPTNQTQLPYTQPHLPSTQPHRNSVGPGGDGYSPTREVDSTWNSPKEGYKYPSTMEQRNMTRPEMDIGWEAKNNKQPNLGDKISNMGMGALNFAKKNLYPGPGLPQNGNTGPELTNHWQTSNQPNYREKNSNTQENGNTRSEFPKISSQGKGSALPEMANRWFSRQPNSGEKNSQNETPDPEFSVPVSQEKGNTRPELENHLQLNPDTRAPNSTMKNKFPVPFSVTFSTEKLNAFSRNPGVPQEKGNVHPDIRKQPNNGDGNSMGGALDSVRQRPNAPDSQEILYGSPEASKGSEISKQPNVMDKFSKLRALDSSRRSQGAPDSPERGNGGPEASNGSENSKQPKYMEKFSKLGALNSLRKNQFPAMFSKEK